VPDNITPNSNTPSKPSFFTSLPGILTAATGLVTAIVAGYIAIKSPDNNQVKVNNGKVEVVHKKTEANLPAEPAEKRLPQSSSSAAMPVADVMNFEISGKWNNDYGYLIINQNGESFTYNDYNNQSLVVGGGTGEIAANKVILTGWNSDGTGGQIPYTANLKIIKNGDQMVGTIHFPSANLQNNIYFDRE